MAQLAITDTGPLVAFLDRRDAHHAWARERFCTLDSDFRIYRKHGRDPISLIIPST